LSAISAAMTVPVFGMLVCSLASGALAVAANQLVERYPRSELLLWAGLSAALSAVIGVAVWRLT
jgi:hypothetical protein